MPSGSAGGVPETGAARPATPLPGVRPRPHAGSFPTVLGGDTLHSRTVETAGVSTEDARTHPVGPTRAFRTGRSEALTVAPTRRDLESTALGDRRHTHRPHRVWFCSCEASGTGKAAEKATVAAQGCNAAAFPSPRPGQVRDSGGAQLVQGPPGDV